MNWIRAALILTALCLGLSALAVSPEETAEWLATGVGARDTARYFNSTFCNTNETQFLACLAGAEVAFKKINSQFHLTNRSLAGNEHFTLDKVVDDVGDLQLTTGTKAEVVDTDWQSLTVRQQAEEKDRVGALRQLFPRHHVDFDRLRGDLERNATSAHYPNAMVFHDFMNALLSFNDPFSSLTPKTTYQRKTNSGLHQNESIGLATVSSNGVWLVKKSEGPAAAAGIRQGDSILSLDGVALSTLKIDQLAEVLKDPKAPVALEIQRGQQKFSIHVTPKLISDSILKTSIMIRASKKLLVIQIKSFYDQNICQTFRTAVEKSSAFDGVIFDLRDNGGGYLDRVNCILGTILGPSVPVISETEISHSRKVIFTTPKDSKKIAALNNKPMTILQNAHTASGSEVFAGALRFYDRALSVGQRTYGKGSVSDGRTWSTNDKFMITVTDGLYFFPDGKTPNKAGLEPDFKIGWRSQSTSAEEFVVRNENNQHNPTAALNSPIASKSTKLAKIHSCMDTQWISNQENSLFGTELGVDFQLLNAEEITRCQ